MPILHRARTPGLWTPGAKPSSFTGLEIDRQACRVPLLASFPLIGGAPTEIVGRVKPVQVFGSLSTIATSGGIGVVGGASGSIQAQLPTSAPPTTFSHEVIFSYGNPSASNGNIVQICEGVGSGAPTTLDRAIYLVSGGINGYIYPSGSISGGSANAGGPFHVVYVVNPAASLTSIYVNGALISTTTITAAYSGYSAPTIRIGWATMPSAGSPANATPILLVNIWDGALTADEVRQRYADPWNFLRPALRRRMFDQSAAAVRPLTAAGTGAGTASATLTRSRALAPAGTAAGSAAAALQAIRALTAAGTSSGTAAATLRRSRALTSAATTSAGAASGSLTRTRPLTTAAAAAATTQAGALRAIRALLAAGTATGTAAASLARRRALLGGGTALSSQTGSIAKFTQGQLAGQGVATGTAAATLHAIRGLTAAGSASTSQAATLARSRGLAIAAGAASGSQAATLRRSRRLVPAGATATTGQAAAQSAVRRLVAAGAATGTAQAAMTRQRALVAAGAAASGQTGAINVSGFLPAPSQIPAGNTITIPLDSRTAAVPLDTRTVTIPF